MLSVADILPKKMFKSLQSMYQLPLHPSSSHNSSSSSKYSNNSENSSKIKDSDLLNTDLIKTDLISTDLLNDLNTDIWPIWFRSQEDGKKYDDSGEVIDSKCVEMEKDIDGALGGEGGGHMWDLLRCMTCERCETPCQGSGSKGLKGPETDIENSLRVERDSKQSDSKHTVLTANVKIIQCSRCVCSGFSAVSGTFSRPQEHSPNLSNLKIDDINCNDEMNDNNDNSLKFHRGNYDYIQTAVDLLFFSISHELKNASLNVNDLRTLRVYWNNNDNIKIEKNNCNSNAEHDINHDNDKEMDGSNITDSADFTMNLKSLEIACEIAARKIFGLKDITDLPLLLIPVTQLASLRPDPRDPTVGTYSDSAGLGPDPQGADFGLGVKTGEIPVLSAHFFCIDLLQIKSEMWIEGY